MIDFNHEIPYFSLNISSLLRLELWIQNDNYLVECFNILGKKITEIKCYEEIAEKTKHNNKKKVITISNNSNLFKNNYDSIIFFIESFEKPIFSTNKAHFYNLFLENKTLSNLTELFGKPHYRTNTSTGHQIFIYFGIHKCNEKKYNGIMIISINNKNQINGLFIHGKTCKSCCKKEDLDFSWKGEFV